MTSLWKVRERGPASGQVARFGVTRLSAATVTDAVGAEVPTYDRSVEPTMVHIGVGAFARAHLAVYADDLLQRGAGQGRFDSLFHHSG